MELLVEEATSVAVIEDWEDASLLCLAVVEGPAGACVVASAAVVVTSRKISVVDGLTVLLADALNVVPHAVVGAAVNDAAIVSVDMASEVERLVSLFVDASGIVVSDVDALDVGTAVVIACTVDMSLVDTAVEPGCHTDDVAVKTVVDVGRFRPTIAVSAAAVLRTVTVSAELDCPPDVVVGDGAALVTRDSMDDVA